MISLKLYRCALGKSTSCDFRKNLCTSRCWSFRLNNPIQSWMTCYCTVPIICNLYTDLLKSCKLGEHFHLQARLFPCSFYMYDGVIKMIRVDKCRISKFWRLICESLVLLQDVNQYPAFHGNECKIVLIDPIWLMRKWDPSRPLNCM